MGKVAVAFAAAAVVAACSVAAVMVRRRVKSRRKWRTVVEILKEFEEGCDAPVGRLRQVVDAMAVEMHAGLASEGGSKLKMLLTCVHDLPNGEMLGVLKIEEASWFNPAGKKKVVTVSGIPASCGRWDVRSDGATVGGNGRVSCGSRGWRVAVSPCRSELPVEWTWVRIAVVSFIPRPVAAVHLSPVVLYRTIGSIQSDGDDYSQVLRRKVKCDLSSVWLLLIIWVMGFDRRSLVVWRFAVGFYLGVEWKPENAFKPYPRVAIGGSDRSSVKKRGVLGSTSGWYPMACRGQH
ncbi:hypothetical protein DY000_02010319 [Brassica cretica]|uniref:Phosphotransferase n=1 Tax=Brassica cretica TaxID=69181 RepID=A0ABQ7CKS0_BRACR|nr:hypothetical protein DY000_02010319 [Brassica cretica]